MCERESVLVLKHNETYNHPHLFHHHHNHLLILAAVCKAFVTPQHSLDRQIQALVEDKYMNHMKMTELEEQRARLACEVECLKAAAKSSTQSEQQWKGFVFLCCCCLIASEHARAIYKLSVWHCFTSCH